MIMPYICPIYMIMPYIYTGYTPSTEKCYTDFKRPCIFLIP